MPLIRNVELDRDKEEDDLLVTFEKASVSIDPIQMKRLRFRARVTAGIQDPEDISFIDILKGKHRTELKLKT